jgi:hypothetical protein
MPGWQNVVRRSGYALGDGRALIGKSITNPATIAWLNLQGDMTSNTEHDPEAASEHA